MRAAERPCGHYDGTSLCGITPTNEYLVGDRCIDHTPAAVAGLPEVVPDPARTVQGLRAAAAATRDTDGDVVITIGGVRV